MRIIGVHVPKAGGLSLRDHLEHIFGEDRIIYDYNHVDRPGAKVKEFFDLWPSLVEAEPHPNQGSLFGPSGRSKEQLIEAWIKQGEYSQ